MLPPTANFGLSPAESEFDEQPGKLSLHDEARRENRTGGSAIVPELAERLERHFASVFGPTSIGGPSA